MSVRKRQERVPGESRGPFLCAGMSADQGQEQLAGLREYSSMETLTPEVVNKIIKRIEVHNSEMLNGHKRVGIDIYFTGVGLVDLATIKEMLAIAESSRP